MAFSWVIFFAVVLFLIFFAVAVAITLFVLYRLKWNYTWVLLQEQPNGKSEVVKRGRCRLVEFADGGEEIFYLNKIKRYRVAYGKRIGRNQIAWAVGQDGYWYNIDFGGVDKKLLELGVYPVDRDMRYAYASARKGLHKEYNQKTFMEKYQTIISFAVLFILILGMCGFAWFMWNGLTKFTQATTDQTTKNLEIQKELAEKQDSILSRLANLQIGSGAITT